MKTRAQKTTGNWSHSPSKKEGFTLTELLVIIGTLAIFAALVLPALARGKQTQGVYCLNNMRQLQLASALYAADNNDYIPKNAGRTTTGSGTIGIGSGGYNWVAGFVSGTGSTNENWLGVSTNIEMATGQPIRGSIGSYVKSASVYKCPAESFIDPTYRVPRVRSSSMNCYVGTQQAFYNNVVQIDNSYAAFFKYSDFVKISPATVFQFLDEAPQSINDGYFWWFANSINDLPAVNHENGTSFSFADGHCEIHQWRNTFLMQPGSPMMKSSSSDAKWLTAHGSYLK